MSVNLLQDGISVVQSKHFNEKLTDGLDGGLPTTRDALECANFWAFRDIPNTQFS